MKRFLLFASVFIIAVGCTTRRVSTTSRTAVEQLLLSTAVDKALAKFDMPMLKDSKVFVDFTNLKGTDVEYLQVALRARVARQGAILVTKAEDAEYVMEVASGGLAMEDKSSLVGMPSLPMPQAPIPVPEMSLFKTIEQTAIMKLLIFVHQNGRFVASDQYFAKGDRDESIIFWYRFQREDDVREGWERADAELTAKKTAKAVTESQNGPASRTQ
ncbi:MAG: hypothetical protein ISS78_12065 [Phycisphaerae bacterium]|nr:hypothetical protein [Phycisphaerae bacterium]